MSAALLALAMWMAQQLGENTWQDASGSQPMTCRQHTDGTTGWLCKIAPEPSIVPAVQHSKRWISDRNCEPNEKLWSGGMGIWGCSITTWTCADKSRVLLTTEDGQKLCWKPQ